MTVIAWDGTTLAADRRATNYGVWHRTTKLRRVAGCLIAFEGNASHGEALAGWFERGAIPVEYPKPLEGSDKEAHMIVIREGGTIQRFEGPHPFVIEEAQYAWGSGRDFALAALHLGKTASEAVAVASHFATGCGDGVDTLTFGDSRDSLLTAR